MNATVITIIVAGIIIALLSGLVLGNYLDFWRLRFVRERISTKNRSLTFREGLVREIPPNTLFSWSGLAGREGSEVIVERHANRGWHYYCTLQPGKELRLFKCLFNTFCAYEVDTRLGKCFNLTDRIPTADSIFEVEIHIRILYHVIDTRQVALEIEDALNHIEDHVRTILRYEIGSLRCTQIDLQLLNGLVETWPVDCYGLRIEHINFLAITLDSKILQALTEEYTHKQTVLQIVRQHVIEHFKYLSKENPELDIEAILQLLWDKFGKLTRDHIVWSDFKEFVSSDGLKNCRQRKNQKSPTNTVLNGDDDD